MGCPPERGLVAGAHERLLGTMPDEQLALRLGRTPGAIEVRHISFGIVPFGWRPGDRIPKAKKRLR